MNSLLTEIIQTQNADLADGANPKAELHAAAKVSSPRYRIPAGSKIAVSPDGITFMPYTTKREVEFDQYRSRDGDAFEFDFGDGGSIIRAKLPTLEVIDDQAASPDQSCNAGPPPACQCGSSEQWRPKSARSSPWMCLACCPPQSSAIKIEHRSSQSLNGNAVDQHVDQSPIDIGDQLAIESTGVIPFVQAIVPWCPSCLSSVGVETPAGTHCFVCHGPMPHRPDPKLSERSLVTKVGKRKWPPEVDPRIITVKKPVLMQ